MKCPYCGSLEDKVVDSRASGECNIIRRRRECLRCQRRYTTYERIETVPLMVIKKDGRREAFDRNKLLAGIVKACEKRPVSTEAVEKLVDDVEHVLYERFEKEVSSKDVGEIVMQKLQLIDAVAYVRFASVYRQFKDINQFMSELKDLLNKKK